MNRRDFFTVAGRYLLFGGLITVSAISLTRMDDSEQGSCNLDVFCSNCKHLPGCDLPDAVDQKSKQRAG